MKSLSHKIASVGISTPAILGLAATVASAQTPPAESQASDEPILELDQADAEGFEATFQDGNIQENDDGSLTLIDDAGDTVATLDTQFQLHSGETIEISYTVAEHNIEADFDETISQDEADEFLIETSDPQDQNDSQLRANSMNWGLAVAGATGGYIGAAGAALTAPFTAGGGLVVAGAAITSATASANAAYQCYG